jgi:hypothetical protein
MPQVLGKRPAEDTDSSDEEEDADDEGSDSDDPRTRKSRGIKALLVSNAREELIGKACDLFAIYMLTKDPYFQHAGPHEVATNCWIDALTILQSTKNYHGAANPTTAELKIVSNILFTRAVLNWFWYRLLAVLALSVADSKLLPKKLLSINTD